MKRILSGVLALLILLFAVAGCSDNEFLAKEDFNVYRDGKLYIDINDVIGNGLIFDEQNDETFRGLKVNDTVTKVKELYGDEIIYPKVRETNSIEKMSVSDHIERCIDDNYLIRFEKISIDGELYNIKQLSEFPVGTEYFSKMLSIRINGAYVSEIRVDYGQGTLTKEILESFGVSTK